MEMPEKDCIVGEIVFETKDGGRISLEELWTIPLPPILEKWLKKAKEVLCIDFPIQIYYISNDYFTSTVKDMPVIIELGFAEIQKKEIYIIQSSNGVTQDMHCIAHELLHFTGFRHRNAWEELNYEEEITRLSLSILLPPPKGLNNGL